MNAHTLFYLYYIYDLYVLCVLIDVDDGYGDMYIYIIWRCVCVWCVCDEWIKS
jgi:hypothetical protein